MKTTWIASALTCFLAGCGTNQSKQPSEAPPPEVQVPVIDAMGMANETVDPATEAPATPKPLTSTSKEAMDEALGEVVAAVGIYRLRKIHNKRGTVMAEWPVLVFADKTEVMLGSFWKSKGGRSPDEKPEYVEQQVRAVGMLHSAPPTVEGAQNLMAPTIAPVDSLELAPTTAP